MIQKQNADGTWSEATPLGPIGWKARAEDALRKRGFQRIPRILAAWDERRLGK